MSWRFALPGAAVLALIGLLAFGLTRDPSVLPSALIGEPAPAFSVPQLRDPEQIISEEALAGQVSVLNVWASWCVACRAEHAVIKQITKLSGVPVYGLNYKDSRAAALRWLEQFGDPYAASIFDASGTVGMDFGVYGVPETFVLDANGVVRYKHVGPVTMQALEETILPLLARLQREAA